MNLNIIRKIGARKPTICHVDKSPVSNGATENPDPRINSEAYKV